MHNSNGKQKTVYVWKVRELVGSLSNAARTKQTALVTLTFLSASLGWLPFIMRPSLDLPVWLPLTCVGLSAALSSFLRPEHWRVFLRSTAGGSFAGFLFGYTIWPPLDKAAIAAIVLTTVGTAVTVFVALVSTFVGSRLSVANPTLRNTAWLALAFVAAFGIICLGLTPPLVARRIVRNERLAAERLMALERAVEAILAANPGRSQLCDGSLLAKNYSGPAFSEEDWRRITGNYVKQDGYFFMIYCRENPGYVIDAHPVRDLEDGIRRFCVDESRKIGCRVEWNRSRYACLPCSK